MLRYFAYFFSVVCHPLLVITYMLLLLLLINPYLFGVNSMTDVVPLIFVTFMTTFFFPVFAVSMMKMLGLVSSIELKDRQERIGPYIATGIFYLSAFRFLLYNPNIPVIFKSFMLGATIGLFVAFFINLFSKVSMHAVGMGGFLGMIVITMILFRYHQFSIDFPWGIMQVSMTQVLMLVILLCGVVGSSRLILKAHNLQDLYGGFIIGFGTQFLALRFLL